jgi:hypothetical protein
MSPDVVGNDHVIVPVVYNHPWLVRSRCRAGAPLGAWLENSRDARRDRRHADRRFGRPSHLVGDIFEVHLHREDLGRKRSKLSKYTRVERSPMISFRAGSATEDQSNGTSMSPICTWRLRPSSAVVAWSRYLWACCDLDPGVQRICFESNRKNDLIRSGHLKVASVIVKGVGDRRRTS